MPTFRALINGSLAVGSLAVLVDSVWAHGVHGRSARPGFLDDRAIMNGILTSGTLLWPVLFDATVGYEEALRNPELMLGLFAPIVLACLQLGTARSLEDAVESPDASRRTEAQILISAALSIGILLLNLTKGDRARQGLRLVILAVMLSVVMVIPSVTLSQHQTGSEIVVHSAQRVALNFAIAFVLTGVLMAAIDRSPSSPKTPGSGPGSAASGSILGIPSASMAGGDGSEEASSLPKTTVRGQYDMFVDSGLTRHGVFD